MKKMILGLLLCLGASQAVAMDDSAPVTQSQISKALSWIKANPKKSAAIGSAIVAILGLGTLTVYEIAKADGTVTDKDGKAVNVKDDGKEVAEFSWMTKFGKGLKFGQTRDAFGKGWTKCVNGKDSVVKTAKEHKKTAIFAGVSTTVILVIAALVIADYVKTAEDEQMKTTQLINTVLQALHIKDATPVVA